MKEVVSIFKKDGGIRQALKIKIIYYVALLNEESKRVIPKRSWLTSCSFFMITNQPVA